MKVLFIGGTGIISAAVSRQAIAKGFDLYLLNRGLRGVNVPGSHSLTADTRDLQDVRSALHGLQFDIVVNWIAYTPDDIDRDLALFQGRVEQYIFISSASVYEKPPAYYLIREETPRRNPYWDYSRNKIACEERLMQAYAEEGFPVTIVRPSQTYDQNFPVAIGGGVYYTLAQRLKQGRPIIVHGDGTSLWVVTHAEDFSRGFLGLVGNRKAIGHAFHITSDEVLTWEQIYQTIAEGLGVEANIVHIPSEFIARMEPEWAGTLLGDKAWSAVFDNSKVKRLVPGFKAVIPFRDGIRRTLEWFWQDKRRQRMDESANEKIEHILKAYLVRPG